MKTSLNVSAFALGGTDSLAILKTYGLMADNDQVDAGGLANRYEYHLNAKQGQQIDFVVWQLNGSGVPSTNLDVSLWTYGSTAYLGRLRSGAINVTTTTKEASGIAMARKSPQSVRTTYEVTADFMVVSYPEITSSIIVDGATITFDATVQITVGGVAFSAPMTVKSTKFAIDRGELQMENVTMSSKGTPTGPTDGSLLALILTGTALISISIDTSGKTISAANNALITKLNVPFADGALIEMQGSLNLLGGSTVAAP